MKSDSRYIVDNLPEYEDCVLNILLNNNHYGIVTFPFDTFKIKLTANAMVFLCKIDQLCKIVP